MSIGENNEKFVEIKQGLSEGDRLALDALARLGAESSKLKTDDAVPQSGKSGTSEPPRATASMNNTNSAKRP